MKGEAMMGEMKSQDFWVSLRAFLGHHLENHDELRTTWHQHHCSPWRILFESIFHSWWPLHH